MLREASLSFVVRNEDKQLGAAQLDQWRNGGGGAQGAECPPPPHTHTLLTGKFLLTYREKRGKEKRENVHYTIKSVFSN